MLTLIKEQFNKLLLCFVYILIGCLVYGIWTYHLWNLWYVTLIVVFVIIAIGVTISYFWIKSEIKKNPQESVVENK